MTEYICEINYEKDPCVEYKEPIKHGRWTKINMNRYGDDEATCSICGCTFASGYSNPSWWDYCPNCGARMDAQIGEDKSHPFAESVMMGMDGGENDTKVDRCL